MDIRNLPITACSVIISGIRHQRDDELRKRAAPGREEGALDVVQNHQFLLLDSSFFIAIAMAEVPTPKFRAISAMQIQIPVVSQNVFFKAYFLRRKKEGLPPQKALFAVAHKLIRVIFAMLSQRTCFKVKEAI